MAIFDNIIRFFDQHSTTNHLLFEQQTPYIAEAANLITHTLAEGGRIITGSCGKTDGAARYLADNLMHSPYIERPGLPAIYINTTVGNRLDQQIQALGTSADVLILFIGRNHSGEFTAAVQSAVGQKMKLIAIYSDCETNADIKANIPTDQVSIEIAGAVTDDSIQHLMMAHLLAQLTEQELFGISL